MLPSKSKIRKFGLRAYQRYQFKKYLKSQKAEGRVDTIVLMHVPKTAGTSFGRFVKSASAQGHPMPIRLHHRWRLRDVRQILPHSHAAVVVRDPIERYISAFNSRLRCGRPLRQIDWHDNEAMSYALFKDPIDWIEGLVSDDDWTISAARFVRKNVNLIRFDYGFYFGSVEAVKANADRLVVGSLEDHEGFVRRVVDHCNIEFDDVRQHLKTYGQARRPTASLTEKLDSATREKLMEYFSDEYEIYHALRDLIPSTA